MKPKLISFILLGIGILFCLSSCEDEYVRGDPTPRLDQCPNLIQWYQEFDCFSCEPCQYDWIRIEPQGAQLLRLSSDSGAYKAKWMAYENQKIYNESIEPSLLFEKLAKSNSDESFFYGKTPDYDMIDARFYGCAFTVMEDIIGVKIEALSDYDATHTAGSSLNDIACFNFCSFYNFIQSGYQLRGATAGNSILPPVIENNQDLTEIFDYELKNYPYFSVAANELAENPIRCLAVDSSKPFALRFSTGPAQECRIRITFTLKVRALTLPAREVSAECTVK